LNGNGEDKPLGRAHSGSKNIILVRRKAGKKLKQYKYWGKNLGEKRKTIKNRREGSGTEEEIVEKRGEGIPMF